LQVANAKFESLKPNRSSFFIQQLKRLKFLDRRKPDNAQRFTTSSKVYRYVLEKKTKSWFQEELAAKTYEFIKNAF
jgi:hypothetical protein